MNYLQYKNPYRSLDDKPYLKKRSGFSMMEIMVGLIVIIALSAGTFFIYSEIQESRKVATMHQDLNNLVMAATSYESFNVRGIAPADLNTIKAGLSAAESNDGVEKHFIQGSRLTSAGAFLDPWGVEYVVNGSDRTVECVSKSVKINF